MPIGVTVLGLSLTGPLPRNFRAGHVALDSPVVQRNGCGTIL